MRKSIATSLFAATIAAALIGCDVDQTQPGELPDVDVDVSGDPGQMPEYDMETPDVDVGSETKEVTVPDVEVTLPDEQE